MRLWDPIRRWRNRNAWHSSGDGSAMAAGSEGAGTPASLHACGRAIIPAQDCDDKWASACRAWDSLRIDVRRIPDENRQADAWLAIHQALLRIHMHVRREFGPDFMEVNNRVDH